MLSKLSIENFKPFRRYSVDLSDFNVITGLNNMGKSSVIDCLRLISLELNYRLRRDFVNIPSELLGPGIRGYQIDPAKIPFPVANVHHNFSDAPSAITAGFDGGLSVQLVFEGSDNPACYLAVFSNGGLIDSVDTIRGLLKGRRLAVLPQVSPLEETEKLLTSKYVLGEFGTRLSSRHFRNLWYYDDSQFEEFATLVSDTWPGVEIGRPEIDDRTGEVTMFFTEQRMAREIAWAGSGMQAWLQLLTYVCKMRDCDTIVLDEPEVYLHSDVQRKLVRLLRSRAAQVILATHSVDIINEAATDQVLTIDKNRPTARRMTGVESVQRLLESLGSLQNAHLLRAFRSKLALIVEGQDRRILEPWFAVLGHGTDFDSSAMAVIPIGGVSNVDRLGDLGWIAKELVGEKINAFTILDRDFSDAAQVADLIERLQKRGIQCHVWDRYEIENYLLEPEVILRLIASRLARAPKSVAAPELGDVERAVTDAIESLRPTAEAFLLKRALELAPKAQDDSTTILAFREVFDRDWGNPEWRSHHVPGSEALSKVAAWSQERYGVSFGAEAVARQMSKSDLPSEVVALVNRLARSVRTR